MLKLHNPSVDNLTMLTFGQLRRLIDHKTRLTVQTFRLSFLQLQKMFKVILDQKKKRDSIFAKAVAVKGPTQRQLYHLHCKLHYPTNPALYHLTQRATTFGVDLTGRFKHQSKLRYWLFSPTFYFKNNTESQNNLFWSTNTEWRRFNYT